MTTRRRVARPVAARRLRSWARTALPVQNQAASTVFHRELQSNLETDLGRIMGEYTITRLLIELFVKSTNAEAVPDFCAFGIVVAGRDAAAAGTASLPTPIQNRHADWMWYWHGFPAGDTAESAAGVFDPVGRLITFDIKSQRKVQERDEVPVIVFENSLDVVRVGFTVSMLVLRS